jgi:hypothetical protein
MESNNVGSPGEIHDHGIIRAVRSVIFGELSTQPPGLDAHHGIELGVEVIRATENLCRNLIFLDWSSRMIESVFCQVAQKFAERLRAVQRVAVNQFFYLRETLFAFDQWSNPGYIDLTGV